MTTNKLQYIKRQAKHKQNDDGIGTINQVSTRNKTYIYRHMTAGQYTIDQYYFSHYLYNSYPYRLVHLYKIVDPNKLIHIKRVNPYKIVVLTGRLV